MAGDENLLEKLPKGNWIGGTIPYFMGDEGGAFTKELIFVDEIPEFVPNIKIVEYDETTLPNVAADEYDNGYSLILIPAFSKLHLSFAENSSNYKDIFHTPILGWITGIDLADLGKVTPKVFNGLTGVKSETDAIVMHIELPEGKAANIDIVNVFTQGTGDSIIFPSTGFSAGDCLINGEAKNFAEYVVEKNIDIKLPLVADYYGTFLNVSFQAVNEKTVNFYAPVFKDVEYKIAAPVGNYVNEFTEMISKTEINPVFTCNCILNYLYAELEGKKTANIKGPITFGEIAYQLLNQTLVYLTVEDI